MSIFSHHRHWPTFKDWALVTIVTGILKVIGFLLAGLWAANRMSLALISGRSLERCESLYLSPALVLGTAGWLLLLGGVVAVVAPPGGAVAGWQAFLLVLGGGGLLYAVRVLIRRGCP